jgi:hypothetical protein
MEPHRRPKPQQLAPRVSQSQSCAPIHTQRRPASRRLIAPAMPELVLAPPATPLQGTRPIVRVDRGTWGLKEWYPPIETLGQLERDRPTERPKQLTPLRPSRRRSLLSRRCPIRIRQTLSPSRTTFEPAGLAPFGRGRVLACRGVWIVGLTGRQVGNQLCQLVAIARVFGLLANALNMAPRRRAFKRGVRRRSASTFKLTHYPAPMPVSLTRNSQPRIPVTPG